eukprot:m.340202 g.340202  ORF g.340202 m.340202 type:complete len:925 (+) comp19181_c0_seq1:47-2821(+)
MAAYFHPHCLWGALAMVCTVVFAAPSNSNTCRITDRDFSLTGPIKIPSMNMELSICVPTNDACPNLKPGFVQKTDKCQSNSTDTFSKVTLAEISSVEGMDSVTYTFSNDMKDTITVNILCDPLGGTDMLSTESSLDVANGGNVTLYSLCACHGGCGVPSNPPSNPRCTVDSNSIDLSGIRPLSFSTEVQGSPGLWMFSPCGPSGALCVDDPGYLTTQDSAGQCDSSNLFNYLDSISELPEELDASGNGGVLLAYSGDAVGQATVIVECDPGGEINLATAKMPSGAMVMGYGDGMHLNMNFSSKCACSQGCPPRKDYIQHGPGQQTTGAGSPVNYPEGYPGRQLSKGSLYVGVGLSQDQCSQACDGAVGCGAFSYSKTVNGTCYLYTSAICDTTTSANLSWTTYWLQDNCTFEHPTLRNRRHDFHGLIQVSNEASCPTNNNLCHSGTSIGRMLNMNDTTSCCAICAADPSCKAFTILKNESVCDLFSKTSSESNNTACVSGQVGPPSPPSPPSPPTPPPWKPDGCSIAGFHFGHLSVLRINPTSFAEDNDDDDAEDDMWEVSLCKPIPEKGSPVYVREVGGLVFSKLENFTEGVNGVDFLFSQPGQGLARIHVECDPQAFPYTLQPNAISSSDSIIERNDSIVTIQLSSKCACSGGCGPKRVPVKVESCHISQKNFSTIPAAIFNIPVNLTDGWSGGKPLPNTPRGMQGNQDFVWSINPCQLSSTVCNQSTFMQARPNNASYCSGSLARMTTLKYYAARKNYVQFEFSSGNGQDTAIVSVSCDSSLPLGTLEPDPAMQAVEATRAGDGYNYYLNLTSRCACDGDCIPHPTRPYHSNGVGTSSITDGSHLEYPNKFPGASTFNGTSCGRGITLNQCEEACDAVSNPRCDSFTYSDGTGLCFLYQGEGCSTYASTGTTTYWVAGTCQ